MARAPLSLVAALDLSHIRGPSTTPKCNYLFLGLFPENDIKISSQFIELESVIKICRTN